MALTGEELAFISGMYRNDPLRGLRPKWECWGNQAEEYYPEWETYKNHSQKDRKDRIVVTPKIINPKVPEQLKLLEGKGKYKKKI